MTEDRQEGSYREVKRQTHTHTSMRVVEKVEAGRVGHKREEAE